MASLFNTRISDTYQGLIKTIDNAAITASLKELTDGNGNSTSIYLNNAGDFKVTAILEFGSLKDTGENIIISKFVDAADGIGNNDNDTTIPTTAAIIDYVAAQITIEDLDFTGDTGSGQIDLDSQIFAIGGTTNEITTVASGQSLTLSLDSTGVNLPDNSTAITQTAGDNSTKIATTSYVDTLDAASDLDFSGDSGTGDVNLNTQTFAVTGTANQIESTASNQGLSLQFPSAGVTLPNGSVATTQSSSDDSTKVATTAYVKGLNNASDLDFTTDAGNGAVVLNSETLSVVGTTNEIETSGSGQEIQIGLPSSISTNLVGNVTGNLTGNVVGDLTGNADTATAWETARDLSLTGQATGTISSVDGTNNVSGAVTLDNNSVTGKVLTGLTSPSASSVLATDTIVEGFGKLQSQVNGLAGGLRFMGSWDADTNSPVLGSGGGEAANGTTTATTANKLVDSSASFTSTVTVGDQVVNQVDGQTALVSNVDSNTTLSLDADIMLTGEAYTIDNSPFITQGHYYVVSVGGTTTLNGISNWTIGDWVIAGANNQWTKLDHSQVDGTGTTGNLTKWSSTSVIADSIVSESGSAITVDGSLTTNTNLSSTGNFAVNTGKFTVAASSGNTAFTGDLAINTNKFTVNATSGNTLVAGDLDVNGANADFAGEIDANGEIRSYYNGANYSRLLSGVDGGSVSGFNSSGGSFIIRDHSYSQIVSDGNFGIGIGGSSAIQKVHIQGTGTTYMHIANDSTGSLATDGADIGFFTGQTALQILNRENDSVIISTNDLPRVTIDGSGNSTFAGNVGIGITPSASFSGLNVLQLGKGMSLFGNTNDDRATMAANLIVNTGTAFEYVMDGLAGRFSIEDGNMLWGTAGAGTAGSVATVDTKMTLLNNGNLGIGIDPVYKLDVRGDRIRLNPNSDDFVTAEIQNTTGSFYFGIDTTTGSAFGGANSARTIFSLGDYPMAFWTNNTERMRIDSSGNVGINVDPSTQLHNLQKTNDRAGGFYTQLNGNNYGLSMFVNSGGYGIIGSNGNFTTDILTMDLNSGNATFAGDVKFTDGAAYSSAASIRQQSNNLIFSGGSDGYYFNKSDNSATHLRITSGGDVEIPTNSAKIKLRSSGSSAYTSIFRDTTNQIVIENTAGTNIFQLDNSGRFTLLGLDGKTQTGSDVRFSTASGELYYNTSSKRYKTDIVNLENSLDKINALRPVRFKDKKTGEATCGLIAEETFEIIPDVVFTKEIEGFNEPQIEGLNYSDLVPFLIKSIQELKAEVDLLKKECKCKN